MVCYPTCPFCENTALSVIDVDVNGTLLKGIQCNACKKITGLYKDYSKKLEELLESIDDLESRLSDLEG
ncbi:MAG: hypothetical protein J1E37_07310 [Prevotella sp.]|nr:hypothetical protein [Prevotella sp.]